MGSSSSWDLDYQITASNSVHQKLKICVVTYQEVVVSKSFSSVIEFHHFLLRDLDPHQHIRACLTLFFKKKEDCIVRRSLKVPLKLFFMVKWETNLSTVMEKADVPPWTERVQEVH